MYKDERYVQLVSCTHLYLKLYPLLFSIEFYSLDKDIKANEIRKEYCVLVTYSPLYRIR